MNTDSTTTKALNITVVGEAEIHQPAERGTVRLTAGFEGATREEIVHSSAALHAELVASITQLHSPESGPVTWWANDQMRVWGQRPWNQQGAQLPIVYYSSASFTIKFSDFVRLSAWLGEVSLRTGVKVDGINWALTDATSKRLTERVQREAVAAATAKATVYAESLNRTQLTAVEISDPGLLADAGAPAPAAFAAMAMRGVSASGGSTDASQLKPEDITLRATVHARFTAV